MSVKELRDKQRHLCDDDLPQDGYGPAVTACEENDRGEFWAGNHEYATQVRYCPFCGAKAPVQP